MNNITPIDQQIELTLTSAAKKVQDYVPDAVVFRQPSSKAAVGLAIMTAGLEHQDVYKPLGIAAGVFTKIINSGTSNFPNDKLKAFCSLVGNDIYIRWLADQCGFDVVTRKSTIEDELEAAQEKIKSLEHDSDLMRGLLTK